MRASDGRFVKGDHWRKPAPHWDAEWLGREYVARGRSASDIAAGAGVTENAIFYWLKKHGIRGRSTAEARSLKHWGASGSANPMHGRTGALNPRYVDGSSPERQRLYAQMRGRTFIAAVLCRDGYRCLRCGRGKESRRGLHVHHVAPWAGNASLRFDKSNVVTLCRGCHNWVHSRANALREFLS